MLQSSAAHAADLAELLDTVRSARAALASTDKLIETAKWDSVRTVIARQPVLGLKKTMQAAVEFLEGDARDDATDALYEALDDIGFLDDFVYTRFPPRLPMASRQSPSRSALLIASHFSHTSYSDPLKDVFVGEERQVLGTKLDYSTPMRYRQLALEHLDAFLQSFN
eukprot:tig00000692_g3275.t1